MSEEMRNLKKSGVRSSSNALTLHNVENDFTHTPCVAEESRSAQKKKRGWKRQTNTSIILALEERGSR
jgi:hypothetical protein